MKVAPSDPRVAARSEKRFIKPFEPLSELEEACAAIQMLVDTRTTSVHTLSPDEKLFVHREVFDRLSISLSLKSLGDALAKELDAVSIPRDAVEVAVWARENRGGFLQEAAVLRRFSPNEVPEDAHLLAFDGSRHDLFMSPDAGFEVVVTVFLARSIERNEDFRFRPFEIGTVLAEERFSVAAEAEVGGMQPKALDDAMRAHFGLPKGSWLYLNVLQDLHKAGSVVDSLEIYIDEEFLNSAAKLREAERQILESIWITNIFSQLVFEVSRSLIADEDWDGTESDSEVLRMLSTQLDASGQHFERNELIERLRDKPGAIAAALTADRELRSFAKLLEEVSSDVSDD